MPRFRRQRRPHPPSPPSPDVQPAQRAQRQAAAAARRSPDVDAGVARLATAQSGNVTRGQLRELGLSDSAISRSLRRGALLPRFRGVYAVAHLAPGRRGLLHAALLAVGDDAALSHRTATEVLECLPRGGGPIDVLVPGRRPRPRAGLCIHETRAAFEVVIIEGLRVTAPLRTLADLSRVATPRELRAAASEALVRGLVTQADVDDARIIEPGAVAPSRGVFERRFYALLRSAGLPRPEANVAIGGYVADFVWVDERVIVETDGYAAHGHRAAFEADRERDAELAATGWVVVRVTWRQLTAAPTRVVVRLARLLALRGQNVGAFPQPR